MNTFELLSRALPPFNYSGCGKGADRRAKFERAFVFVNAGDKDDLTGDRVRGFKSAFEHNCAHLSATRSQRQVGVA
jgi:hypothetical protein